MSKQQGSPQLALFHRAITASTEEQQELRALEIELDRHREIAAKIPSNVYLGTSSWSFPGWKGLIYPHKRSVAELASNGLVDYCKHPLMRTVGIDRGFYNAIPREDLQRYNEQSPPEFRFCTKVAESITCPIISPHRDRANAGKPNEDFLSPSRFAEEMALPFVETLQDKVGPFVFEFPPIAPEWRMSGAEFADALDDFLAQLPGELQYAVELRERTWFTKKYLSVIERYGVAHVYNYWSWMPTIGQQLRVAPLSTQPFMISRIMLRPGSKYEEQKARFAPFNMLVEPDPSMRNEVLGMLREAIERKIPAYVLVNNKAEGSSPRTVTELAALLAQSLEGP